MPIYMDVHILPGVKARDVAEAHQLDLGCQDEHGCKCMTYWIDEERENVFCLIEAPSMESVEQMHQQAHGLVPHRIIEVNSSVVESFLGRIYDPEIPAEGLKVFKDPSFRILLVTTMTDPVLLQHELGADRSGHIIGLHNEIIRRNILAHKGREAEYGGAGFVISFTSAANALSCALAIQKEMKASEAMEVGLKMALNAGEPVETSKELFGDVIAFARNLCSLSKNLQLAVTSTVNDLVTKDQFQYKGENILNLSPADEDLLTQLFSQLEANWQNADFDAENYCQGMAMSRSQLYRKTVSLTGFSPNLLLKEFRLEKAKEMMKKKACNIAQVTFESGFSSPSYFTKCFKKKYGMLPMTYLDLLH